MMEIGMDQHKRFSLAVALDPESGWTDERRFEHEDEDAIRRYVGSFDGPVRVTLETTGNWYWLADLVEEAGASMRLCHALEAKRRRRGKAKTDRLDALALAELSAEDRVPEAYAPKRADRDRRERHRFRIQLVRLQTRLKNIAHALPGKLNIEAPFTDAFGKSARAFLDGLSLREPYEGHLRSALRVFDALEAEIARERDAIRTDATLRAFYNRQLRGNGKRKAHVAAARKLAVAVHHMLARRQPYRPAPSARRRSGKPVLRLGRP